ncbi:MAG TPA: MFS transporter, partial [Blastocatellia bacterium]|nr:MFS transporter [Blastocatellia bacterium]
MSQKTAARQAGYIDLVRSNQDFRRLWMGQAISELGDWFNSVALFTLLLNLTGTSEAVGYILIIKLLPTFLIGPLAGVAADRFNRKMIMIGADLARGLMALGFLFIDRPEQVWLVYVITALQMVGTSFFEPARSAAIPRIVSRDQLISANALSGATWSATLALGAALGGIVTDALGRDAAFIIDSVSFFLSAAVISFVRLPSLPGHVAGARLSLAEATGAADLIEGARYLKSAPRVMALLLVKSGWGMGGG